VRRVISGASALLTCSVADPGGVVCEPEDAQQGQCHLQVDNTVGLKRVVKPADWGPAVVVSNQCR